jgi:hypothetical protein
VSQTRAADDFATIRARLEELRRERERAERAEKGCRQSRREVPATEMVQSQSPSIRRLRDAAGKAGLEAALQQR